MQSYTQNLWKCKISNQNAKIIVILDIKSVISSMVFASDQDNGM